MTWLKILCGTLPLLLAVPLRAGTIVSTLNVTGNSFLQIGHVNASFPDDVAEASWTQTGSFSNVSVSAEIDPGLNQSSAFTGIAYLMTQVGPGTTVSNEIANAPFSVTGTEFNPTLVTLFSGLTLGPGTYYLVLSAPASEPYGGWESALGTTPTTAPGVSIIGQGFSGNSAGYAPSTSFSFTSFNSNLNTVEYDVTGNSVPEPSTLPLLLLALIALGAAHRRGLRA